MAAISPSFISKPGGSGGGSPGVSDHEDLTGLLGGAAGDHYHLTAAELAIALAADAWTPSSVDTVTNKRITARVGSVASSATPTINTDNYDVYKITALAVDITSFTTNLTGTPADNDILIIEITGTATRAITWGAAFEGSTLALPTTTIGTAILVVGFLYNIASSKWNCVAATSGGSYAALAGLSTQAFDMATAAVDTNTSQGASTAFVLGQASASNPLMDGTVSVGTSYRYSRQDHVHPSDTSRALLAGSSSQAFSTAALGITGDITLNGTGRRFYGDFSSAPHSLRSHFQTTTVNGNTALGAIPNGTATTGILNCYNSSDPANASLAQQVVTPTEVSFRAANVGTGIPLPIQFWTNAAAKVTLDTSGNLGIANTPSGTYKLEVTGDTGLAGNLALTGSSRRIQGDFSNTTLASKTMLQSSTTNGNSIVEILTNGTGTTSSLVVVNGSDPDNCAFATIGCTATAANFNTNKRGTGTALPLQFNINGTQRVAFATDGTVGIGNNPSGTYKLEVTGKGYCSETIGTGGYTVATLPTGVTGMRTYVTNALGPTFGATVVGGGAVITVVFYDGTNWKVG